MGNQIRSGEYATSSRYVRCIGDLMIREASIPSALWIMLPDLIIIIDG